MAFDIVLRDNGTNDFDINFGVAAETVNRDAKVPADWAGAVIPRDAQFSTEFLASTQRDARMPLDFGVLEVLVRDAQVPIESTGVAQVSRDALVPIESQSQVPAVVLGNYIGVVGAVAFGVFSRVYPTPYYVDKVHSTRGPRRRTVPRRRAREVHAKLITQAIPVRPMIQRILLERLHVPTPKRRSVLVAEASFVDELDEAALVLLL